MNLSALAFDAYGTLFDVHSVIRLCEELWPGKGERLSQLWRTKQLEFTWQRTLMGRYEDFGRVTEAGLRYACDALGLSCGDAQRQRLMDEYLQLATFPDVKEALSRLSGLKLAVLSNGSPAMLRGVVANAALSGIIPHVLSVDEIRMYKPRPEVYEIAVRMLGVKKEAIGFVSSNCWDACGAKSYGFTTFWINRSGVPVDGLGSSPDHVVRSLAELPALIAG